MPFTEPAFLFHFLPATLAAYHLTPARLKNLRGASARRVLVLRNLMRVAILSVFEPTSERSTWSHQAMLDPALFAAEAPEGVTFDLVDLTL